MEFTKEELETAWARGLPETSLSMICCGDKVTIKFVDEYETTMEGFVVEYVFGQSAPWRMTIEWIRIRIGKGEVTPERCARTTLGRDVIDQMMEKGELTIIKGPITKC